MTKSKNLFLRKMVITVLMLVFIFSISQFVTPTNVGAQVPIYTPTPGEDGVITYIVQPGDTLIGISLIFNIPVEELRRINNMTGDDITAGQKLNLGQVAPTPQPQTGTNATSTVTPVLPTPSLSPGTGDLCILLFNDLNGDSIRQEDEPSIPGGAISINNRSGSISQAVDTIVGLDPQCFEELVEGEYSISVAIPEGFNPTTQTSHVLELKAGDETYIDFGAQASSEQQAETSLVTAPGRRIPILGIFGGLLLLAGIGVALLAGRLLKSK